jgi:hypothetical protein
MLTTLNLFVAKCLAQAGVVKRLFNLGVKWEIRDATSFVRRSALQVRSLSFIMQLISKTSEEGGGMEFCISNRFLPRLPIITNRFVMAVNCWMLGVIEQEASHGQFSLLCIVFFVVL